LNIKKTNYMFKGCISLSYLSDLSLKNNSKMFDNDCLSLLNILL